MNDKSQSEKVKAYEEEFKTPVHVDYEDGRYHLQAYTVGHAQAGIKAVMVSKAWLHDYHAHCMVDNIWQTTLQQLDNKQYALNHPEEKNESP